MVKYDNFDDDGRVDSRNILPGSSRRRSRALAPVTPTGNKSDAQEPYSAEKGKTPSLTGKVGSTTVNGRASAVGKGLEKSKSRKPGPKSVTRPPGSIPDKAKRQLESHIDEEDHDLSPDSDQSDGDFSSESDNPDTYEPSDDSDESSEDSESEDDESSESSEDERKGKRWSPRKAQRDRNVSKSDEEQENQDPARGSKTSSAVYVDIAPTKLPKRQLEGYFENSGGKRLRGPRETLDGLEIKRLDNDTIVKAVMKTAAKTTHEHGVNNLNHRIRAIFPNCMVHIQNGWNVVLYGFGSKKNLLDGFADDLGAQRTHVKFNGYLPNAHVKFLLKTIIEGILEEDHLPAGIENQLALIRSHFHSPDEVGKVRDNDDNDIYILMYGLDKFLSSERKDRSQRRVLEALATMTRIHIVATVDSTRTDGFWSFKELAKLKFAWFNVTNFEPYLMETWWQGTSGKLGLSKFSLRVGDKGAIALTGLHHLFSSLTKNAKEIFFHIARYQLKNTKADAEDMAFADLYQMCRDEMLVTSDAGLRGQLTEFVDHNVLRFGKRKSDAQESVRIPLDKTVLAQFLEEQDQET